MQRIWVLGAGQLGTMLRYSGLPLDLDVRPVDFYADQVPQPDAEDRVTAEIEMWPATDATNILATHPNFINAAIFGRLADRLTQKSTLDELGIATSPWLPVTKETQAGDLLDKLGSPCLLKRRTGGYDGRGQLWINSPEDLCQDWRDVAIAEKKIAFEEEISIIGVRGAAGQMFFYPLALNLHQDGILMASIGGLERLSPLQQQAENMLGRLMEGLNYVGVMAMELFRIGDKLMVNEVAPRVHNSGHWTLSGSSISQFDWHLRAVADLPLTPALTKGVTLMVNLIGTPRNDEWIAIPGIEMWWYGKSVRPGRKLGHLNICHSNTGFLLEAASELRAHLPDNYQPVIDWVLRELS